MKISDPQVRLCLRTSLRWEGVIASVYDDNGDKEPGRALPVIQAVLGDELHDAEPSPFVDELIAVSYGVHFLLRLLDTCAPHHDGPWASVLGMAVAEGAS